MNVLTMQEMTSREMDDVGGGGISGPEGAGIILGLVGLAATSPIVLGVGFGAAAGLLIAHMMAS